MESDAHDVESQQVDIERLKLEFEKKTFWADISVKLMAPLLAAIAVALIGAHVIADLKPIHLETGTVRFDVGQTDRSCLCRNTVRKAYVNLEAPLDVDGQPCSLSPSAVERNDRADIRGPYYLTSDFEPRKSIADRRCYRQAVVSVKHSFSQVPRVSLQVVWIDALTHDETDDGQPVMIGSQSREFQKGLNLRFDLRPERVTKDGFDVVLRTWYDSRIYAAEVSYIAFIQ